MLTRIYIDDFRCLVNFEVKLENNISLFLGGNGSGKTTVFNVLEKLQKFIIGNTKISESMFQLLVAPFRTYLDITP
ncbi:MAG: AAA family ATPase [Coleofasciculus chthonoplastes F3-SA18-01]|uniref:AAA family ATPase n=1 Tax=Coleofasciculus chthonoplastes TaxID=64178 RepID=UPI0032F6E75F